MQVVFAERWPFEMIGLHLYRVILLLSYHVTVSLQGLIFYETIDSIDVLYICMNKGCLSQVQNFCRFFFKMAYHSWKPDYKVR